MPRFAYPVSLTVDDFFAIAGSGATEFTVGIEVEGGRTICGTLRRYGTNIYVSGRVGVKTGYEWRDLGPEDIHYVLEAVSQIKNREISGA
ncbi:MAG: hypothetical protein HY368_01205 [Candidatus Aenigmarchaeota archaeon]|nr:hypothetical protein [Candidatus Aenigmarchaeota archaeon]